MSLLAVYTGMGKNPGADPGIPHRRGCQPSRGGGRQHTKLPNFPKNCMKLRKFQAINLPMEPSKLTNTISLADLRGAQGTCAPPGCPNSFDFMQFSGKFGKIICWRPPPPPGEELVRPSQGNPGSANVFLYNE